MKKIFYVLNNNKDPNFSSSIEIINFIKKQKAVIYTDDKLLAEKANINIVNEIDLEVIDLAIVLGGDGTMLKYYRSYGKYNIPTLGINNGRIGALAIVNLNDYKEKTLILRNITHATEPPLHIFGITENVTMPF